MKCNLAVIKGDGIGPEIVTEAVKYMVIHLIMIRY